MHDFVHARPPSLEAALALLREHATARPLAGGMSLIPILKQRLAAPSLLVDLAGIDGIAGVEQRGDRLHIGAMTTHDAVARAPLVRARLPALARLAAGIGDPQVRNRGTLGGALAGNDPAGDWPAAALGLGAAIHTDRRTIDADEFFVGFYQTALAEGELIVGASFPVPRRAGYAKFEQAASRYALAGVFVADTVAGARVAICGAAPCVFRQRDMERALTATFSPSSLAGVRVASTGYSADLHASAEYRAHLVQVMARRAVIAAG